MHRRRRDHRRPFAGSGGGAGGRVNRGNRGYRRIVTGTAARYDEIADFYDAAKGESVADPATAALLRLAGPVSGMRLASTRSPCTGCPSKRPPGRPSPGQKWARRLPGAAPVPVYLAGRCRRR
jgi:hypothetical protein